MEKKLNVFGYFSESLFSIWQNFEPSLVTLPFVCYSADLYYKKLPNIYKSSSHLVTLLAKKSNKKTPVKQVHPRVIIFLFVRTQIMRHNCLLMWLGHARLMICLSNSSVLSSAKRKKKRHLSGEKRFKF